MARKRVGSIRRSAVATRLTSVAGEDCTAAGSKLGSTVSGVPVSSARVTTARPPTWESGRQASQWSSLVTANRSLDARADAATASWVSTTPFGVAGRAACRDHQGVAILDGAAARQPVLGAVGVADHGDGEGGELIRLGRCRESLIEREGGVAAVPDAGEGVDEAWPGRQIEGDEVVGHVARLVADLAVAGCGRCLTAPIMPGHVAAIESR